MLSNGFKKMFVVLLAWTLTLGLLNGCGNKKDLKHKVRISRDLRQPNKPKVPSEKAGDSNKNGGGSDTTLVDQQTQQKNSAIDSALNELASGTAVTTDELKALNGQFHLSAIATYLELQEGTNGLRAIQESQVDDQLKMTIASTIQTGTLENEADQGRKVGLVGSLLEANAQSQLILSTTVGISAVTESLESSAQGLSEQNAIILSEILKTQANQDKVYLFNQSASGSSNVGETAVRLLKRQNNDVVVEISIVERVADQTQGSVVYGSRKVYLTYTYKAAQAEAAPADAALSGESADAADTAAKAAEGQPSVQ